MSTPQPIGTGFHPILALRVIGKPIGTTEVFELVDLLRGKTTARQLARFRRSHAGRAMLSERRSLFARLNDRSRLAQLPHGSLGRAYYDLTLSANVTADELVDASHLGRSPALDELTWFRERNRDMHDLLHVTTGYGCDPLGEICVLAFSYAQTGLKGFALIAIVGALRLARRLRSLKVLRAALEAYRNGRHAAWLIDADWENLLSEHLGKVRARFQVSPPVHYPQLRQRLAAARASGTAD